MRARLLKKPVMTMHRGVLKHRRLVYLLVSSRPIKYKRGKSKIAYIGTTSKGVQRVATSAAYRASKILSSYGSSEMTIHVVTCPPQKRIRTWLLLERALLAHFVTCFWEPPKCNAHGKNFRWTSKLSQYFTKNAIDKILEGFDG